MRQARASDVLEELLEFSGRRVLDVGCGDGNLVRLLSGKGALVTGLECQTQQLAKALAAPKAGQETYVDAGAQNMPFAAEIFDTVIFFNSLHHVPPPFMDQAIREAARVLKIEGVLYVSEPIADGAFFELARPVDDETEVRKHAYAAIQEAAKHGFSQVREERFLHPMALKSFQEFRTRIVSANHEREALVESMAATLEAEFRRLGQMTERGYLFLQPTRVNILRKVN